MPNKVDESFPYTLYILLSDVWGDLVLNFCHFTIWSDVGVYDETIVLFTRF